MSNVFSYIIHNGGVDLTSYYPFQGQVSERNTDKDKWMHDNLLLSNCYPNVLAKGHTPSKTVLLFPTVTVFYPER